MPYLLDGNNLIGIARGSARPSEEDRRALIAEIASRMRNTRARATLFFDGPAGAPASSFGNLLVRVASGGSADDAIAREVERARDRSSMIVVSADRGLGRRVRDLGGKVCSPAEFWARFGQGARGGEVKTATESVDVEEWAKYFQDEANRDGGGTK